MDSALIARLTKKIVSSNGTGHAELETLVSLGEISSEEAAIIKLRASIEITHLKFDQILEKTAALEPA